MHISSNAIPHTSAAALVFISVRSMKIESVPDALLVNDGRRGISRGRRQKIGTILGRSRNVSTLRERRGRGCAAGV